MTIVAAGVKLLHYESTKVSNAITDSSQDCSLLSSLTSASSLVTRRRFSHRRH